MSERPACPDQMFYLPAGHAQSDPLLGLHLLNGGSHPIRVHVWHEFPQKALEEDVSKVEIQFDRAAFEKTYHRSRLQEIKAELEAAHPHCADCRGTGKYQGLGAPEDCRACGGKGRV